ncbi:MAG: cupredoxin domain-containing protein [Anaerolineae bacterium]
MRLKRAILLVLALAVLLAACGGSASTVTVAMKDMRFLAEAVNVKAGQAVTLRVVNQDGYAHAFDIDAFDLHHPLAANETAELTFTPPAPGRYRFYCGTPGHEAAGMVGVLVVEP